MKLYKFALLILLALTCSGCGVLHPGIRGSGVVDTQYRNVAPFQEVDLSGFGTVDVVVGEAPSVCVTTDDNLIGHIETAVEHGKLKIRPTRSIRPKSGLNVTVTMPHLQAASVSGAGDMNVHQVVGDSLDMSISGAGTITADGMVNHLTTTISGAGDADLEHLYSQDARVKVSGAGDVSVFASNSIDARISGAGDVVCLGNPQFIEKKVSGAGDFVLEHREGPMEFTIGDASPDKEIR